MCVALETGFVLWDDKTLSLLSGSTLRASWSGSVSHAGRVLCGRPSRCFEETVGEQGGVCALRTPDASVARVADAQISACEREVYRASVAGAA